MITLINGFPQGLNALIVPNGSISFQLNTDATVIAAPYGFVAGGTEVVFQFDATGHIQPNAPAATAQIYSNLELNPQNSVGLGTYYLVTFYDQNGARLNKAPLWWQFPQVAGSTVDISEMTAFATVGGNVIYYPTVGAGGGSVTSVAFVGDGTILSSTPSTAVTASGNVVATLLTQNANIVLAGPTSGGAALPTFRGLVVSDLPSGYIWSNLAAAGANLTLANTTFSSTWTNTQPTTYLFANVTAATVGANQNSNTLSIRGTLWTGASATDTWSLQNVIGSGTNPTTTLTFSHAAGGSGAALIQFPSAAALQFSTDTGISRSGAGVLNVGNGTPGDATGALIAASLKGLTGQLTPNAAGGIAIGTTALPFASLWIGSTAAHNAQLTGAFTGNRVLTFQDSTDTIVGRATTDTLTNKTLTDPVINGTPSGTGIPTTTVKTGSGGGNYSSASTAYVAIDNTNLTYTVTIPVGWKLMVWATADVGVLTAAVAVFFAIVDGVTTLVESQVIPSTTVATSTKQITLMDVITGDGASHTVTMQYRTSNAADSVTAINTSSTLTPHMTFLLTPSN